MYGVEVSPALISEVTDAVVEELKARQNWALVNLGDKEVHKTVKFMRQPIASR